MTLERDDIELLADVLAERLTSVSRQRLRTVTEVAEYLAVDASFVYEHAVEMDAQRLGFGPKAPLRFDIAKVDEWLRTCTTGRGTQEHVSPAQPRKRRRRRRPGTGTNVVLLPIRGVPAAEIAPDAPHGEAA